MNVRSMSPWLVGMVTVLLAGCSSASKDPSVAGDGVLDLTDSAARATWANHFWAVDGAPDLAAEGIQRVAIVEFVTEFVTKKTRFLTFEEVEYSQYVMDRFPEDAYALFCEELESRGLEIISPAAVRSSKAYARFDTRLSGSAATPRELDAMAAADAGRAMRVVLGSPEALRVLELKDDSAADVEKIAADLREELGADVVVRARIRVGVHQQRAALETGSVIWLSSRESAGRLIAKRTWLSEARVIEKQNLSIGRGKVIDVDVNKYLSALRSMFSAFMEMALQSEPPGDAA